MFEDLLAGIAIVVGAVLALGELGDRQIAQPKGDAIPMPPIGGWASPLG